MKATKFFEERSDQSEVKARIVTKYFVAWAQVIMPTAAKYGGKIAYIDLYAGPGRYKDGAASTPLLVLQTAIDDFRMARMLVAYFNDSRNENTATLQEEIDMLPGIEKLSYKPFVTCGEVDDEAARYFNDTKLIPSFSFIDPFGYKGLSLNIIKGVIKDWGCDCVFFFNYNRINAGIGNDFVAQHMDDLFGGKERADELRVRLPTLTPELREAAILEELANEIKRLGGTYVLPFTFKNASGKRTSHKLIFVSKNFRGYSIMKGIMAGESSTHDEGVPSFIYSPADASMPLLFSLAQPLSQLKESLLAEFAGQDLHLRQVYESHSVDTPFVEKNYRQVLKRLEIEGAISVRSTKGKRRVGTFPDHVLISFPARERDGH
jgi:three-Cys-motif partner protein